MSFSIGIVGLPNVGKSTLFKALTKKQVDAQNYPFCTIDPNIGVVNVPDERFDKLCKALSVSKKIPTIIEFVDIAGLVKGASKGDGLGNKFLANIREVDAIIHILRSFEDSDIIHVNGQIDPKSDQEIIETELILADLAVIEKAFLREEKSSKSRDKRALLKTNFYKKIKSLLEKGENIQNLELSEDENIFLEELHLLSVKPVLYVYNVSEESLNKDLKKEENSIVICAKLEAELAELNEKETADYRMELEMPESGLDKMIIASYKLLKLITFFTASSGGIAQAWTIRAGMKAPKAAGSIHSDFEKGFIRAEVISWNNLLECHGEATARDRGLIRTEGKNYTVQDGDVIHFLFSK